MSDVSPLLVFYLTVQSLLFENVAEGGGGGGYSHIKDTDACCLTQGVINC